MRTTTHATASVTLARRIVFAGCVAGALMLTVSMAHARPSYFDAFTTLYGIGGSDNLNACGVCHIKWTGTGARNPFGSAVEQQLYLGKTVTQSLMDIEGDDTDTDGFTNGDEIMTYLTLPGYSCDNFLLAIDPPSDWHTFITPMVASCLVPHDIRVTPTDLSIIGEAGELATAQIEIFNNGSSVPLEVTSYGLVDGTDPELAVSGPALPVTIPINTSILVEIQFTPAGFVFLNDDFRVESDDPDEPIIDVPIQAFGIVTPLASPENRFACFKEIDKNFQRYAKRHLKEWNRCYLDEVQGVACDTARRDLKIEKAEAKLRERIGGEKDRRCDGNNLSPSFIGYPDFCGGGCGAIETNTYDGLVDCLVCRQDEGRDASLTAALGTAPPDLPANVIAGKTVACQRQLLKQTSNTIAKGIKILGGCELDNITAAVPVDCATEHAEALAKAKAKADGVIQKCGSTTGLDGCLFDPEFSVGCIGDAALSVSSDLTDTVFGLE